MPKIDTSAIENFDAMTPEEKVTALLGIDIPEKIDLSKYVSKEMFDKKASEAAEASKKLKAATSDADGTAERIAALEKALQVKDWTQKYMDAGYDRTTAEETANALSNGDMDTVFANAEKYKTSLETKIKEDLMKNAGLSGSVGSAPKGKDAALEQAKRIGQAKANATKDAQEVLKHYL